jgi:hypothetical protein
MSSFGCKLTLVLIGVIACQSTKLLPSQFTASVKVSNTTNVVSSGTLIADVKDSRAIFQVSVRERGFSAGVEFAFFSGTSKQYEITKVGGSFLQCLYADLPSNETIAMVPDLTNATFSGYAVIRGIKCEIWSGFGCFEATFEKKPICSRYEFFLSGRTLQDDSVPIPVRFQLLSSHAVPFLFIDYYNVSLAPIPDQDFQLPSPFFCRSAVGCENCGTPSLSTFLGHQVCNLPLLPTWIGAVAVGIFCGLRILSLGPGVVGSLSYGISFLTYAVMMTSGFVTHSLFLVECKAADPTLPYYVVSIIDGSLSTCIAVSFFFNALVDARVLKERTAFTTAIMAGSYVAVFVLYLLNFSVFDLYFVGIIVCCGSYVVVQLFLLLSSGCKGVSRLLLAAVAGGIGLPALTIFACDSCHLLGNGAPETMWYALADVSMFSMFLFVMATRQREDERGAYVQLQALGDEDEFEDAAFGGGRAMRRLHYVA